MEKPNYVLKTYDAELIPVKQKNITKFLKIGVWSIVIILILGSFLFQDNLFLELSWTSRILLIALAIGVTSFGTKKEYSPSELELQFYDDYIIFYLPKRYYSKRVTRMELIKMNYEDISKCVIDTKNQRVYIYGNGIARLYNYKKDGTLPSEPTDVRNAKDGLMYFDTCFDKETNFKKEIEEHSPIKVIVENG